MVLAWVAIIETLLVLIGAALGNLFTDPLKNLTSIYWFSICILLGTINLFLVQKNSSNKESISQLNNRLTALLIKKDTHNQFDIAIEQNDKQLVVNNPTFFSVYVSCPIQVDDLPDLLIKANKKIIINTSEGPISETNYGNQFHYFINNDMAIKTSPSKLCCCFRFDVVPTSIGKHDIFFQLKNSDLIAETKYSFDANL